MWTLTIENAAEYLRVTKVCSPQCDVQIEMLPGGVSNIVLAARCLDRAFVLKQALPRLMVDEEWLSDIERIEREAQVQQFLASLLGGDIVPAVVFEDIANHIYIMDRAPLDCHNWKEVLLGGEANNSIAKQAGRILAAIHGGTAGSHTAMAFIDKRYFGQLRLDPYYTKVAQVYPSLQVRLTELSNQLLQENVCLVHGDYSPKNMLIRGNAITLLDFEVGHYGHPAFDLGFFLTHLFLKTLKHRAKAAPYADLIRTFWNEYTNNVKTLDARTLEDVFLPHLGAILLARVDGKSKVNYLSPKEQEFVRNFSPAVIEGNFGSLEITLATFEKEIKYLRAR